ncbi:MAG: phosphoribosylglycinamide formyltransferase [Spirochaetales bacterium]|nr:phosphoribosylglycinamide formyltransferase [Spirochaetales bacterium]MCF7938634.1 phosphoribosylglycinamide formyltransferase [Spirochaetales bacterium]
MAKAAFLASGNGSNFQAICEAMENTSHQPVVLIYDRKNAKVPERARELEVASRYVPYAGRSREKAEETILEILDFFNPDLIVLAGFMRILTEKVISRYEGRIINIHPSLLPAYPGTRGIEESYLSDDKELGITIHLVDEGLDSGTILKQVSFRREGTETLSEIEERIHTLEHTWYPRVVLELLDQIETEATGR